MPSFKKYKGNFKEVMENLALHPDFYAPSDSKTTYSREVAMDLNRMPYLNLNADVATMQQQLSDIDHIPEAQLSYVQGTFEGRVFCVCAKLLHPLNEIYQSALTSGKLKTQNALTLPYVPDTLNFHYVDDEGKLCGFSISYLGDYSNLDTPLKEIPLLFNVSIIRNVIDAVENREVTVFIHPRLELPAATKGKNISAQQLNQEIRQAVNCQAVTELLSGILEQGVLFLEPFNKLCSRLTPNHNLDNRDPKLDKLFDLSVIWVQLARDKSPNNDELMEELLQIIHDAYEQVDYFKDKTIEDVNKLVVSYQKHPTVASLPMIDATDAQKIKQTFRNTVQTYRIQMAYLEAQYAKKLGYPDAASMKDHLNTFVLKRNKICLILIGLALVSIILSLTGILSPVGLALGIAVAFLAGLLITCSELELATHKSIVQNVDGQNQHKNNLRSIWSLPEEKEDVNDKNEASSNQTPKGRDS